MNKTNAMRMLEKEGVPFRTQEYPVDENDLSGEHVAAVLGQPAEQVFKTLVTKGEKNGIMVFCIPVCEELDLKKIAVLTKDKKVEMIPVKDLLSFTGYIRGGCSPIGMKKKFPTVIDESCLDKETVMVSAGKIGYQVELTPQDLIQAAQAQTANITKDN